MRNCVYGCIVCILWNRVSPNNIQFTFFLSVYVNHSSQWGKGQGRSQKFVLGGIKVGSIKLLNSHSDVIFTP